MNLLLVVFVLLMAMPAGAEGKPPFVVAETTIEDVHTAFREGTLTSRELVGIYLERIERYDQSTHLNAIVIVNLRALEEAEALDLEFAKTGKLRPLHGIPLIIKDNFDTAGLQTAGGSLAMKGSSPPDDAFQIMKLREAGAIVLAKSNMAEWAFSPMYTVSSIAGITRNAYDLDRVPAGSSGGTAAAVAANFGVAGMGTDTGNSIRGPSSHAALVGIRSTMGLTSRDGVIPLYLRNDIAGPMARTVEDAVRLFEVIAGPDPADPITEHSRGKVPESYTQFLDPDGLKGARIGVFRAYVDDPDTDPQIRELIDQAVVDLRRQGAEVVDPFEIPELDELRKDIWCDQFQHDVNQYLESLGDGVQYKTIREIYESGLYSPSAQKRLERALEATGPPEMRDPPCRDLYQDPRNIKLRHAVQAAMDDAEIDAFVYPTWSNPPRRVGDLESPAGDNSQILSPHTGFPAITVPMGYTRGADEEDANLPAGLTFIGRLFSEPDLIRYVYAYEQSTRHRKPSPLFP